MSLPVREWIGGPYVHHQVYDSRVERTQIYLAEADIALLEEQVSRTGASRSELIRRAVQACYGGPEPDRRRTGISTSSGAWRGRRAAGAEYVADLRPPLVDRLDELGLS